ncbi:MAG TPA: sugar ABC transporter permease [Gaiellaceae bacterium]|nr:sugar ABC transporter permease [Gaiellaceae bacterium]
MTSAATTAPVSRRDSLFGARLREAGWGYAFVLVPMAVFGLFFIYPFGYAIYISFFHWGILGKQGGTIWFHNYDLLWKDPIFHIAIKNTLEYTAGVLPLEMAVGLVMAIVVNQNIRAKNFWRAAFYFPSLASSVAITTIALYLGASDGLINHALGTTTPWFSTAGTVTWAIVVLNAWTTSGTVMLFYLAALQSIPTDVYEAAAVDNTGTWRTFWKITFPLLRPAHFFVMVVFGIGALKVFDQQFIASGGTGGPNNATQTAVLYIYREAFQAFDFGIAAAAGVVVFVIIFALTLVQRLTVGRQEPL